MQLGDHRRLQPASGWFTGSALLVQVLKRHFIEADFVAIRIAYIGAIEHWQSFTWLALIRCAKFNRLAINAINVVSLNGLTTLTLVSLPITSSPSFTEPILLMSNLTEE